MLDLEGLNDGALAQAERARIEQFRAVRTGSKDAALEAAKEFEGLVIGQLLAPMFESIATDGRFGGGEAERIWRQHLVAEIGKEIAQSGGIGIADQIYPSLLAQQEV